MAARRRPKTFTDGAGNVRRVRAAPAKRPKSAIDGTQTAKSSAAGTEMINVRGADGVMRKVRMSSSEAAALRRKRTVGATTKLIPRQYRGMVDAGQIADAVESHMQGLEAPLTQHRATAQGQYDTNVRDTESIHAQTQASLDQLYANSQVGARDLEALAVQRDAARVGQEQRAGEQASQVLGAAFNPLVAEQATAYADPGRAVAFADQVQGTTTDRLMQQGQSDFFQRGKGIAAMTQQSFTRGQRDQLANVLRDLALQQTAIRQGKGSMIAEMAEKEAGFAFEQQKAANEEAIARQAMGLEAQQQAFENNLATYGEETDRLGVLTRGRGGRGGGGASPKSFGFGSLTKDQQKLLAGVRSHVDGLVEQTRSPTTVRNADGTSETRLPSNSDVFGPGNGPWREAFDRLTSAEVGLNPGQAATIATGWFGRTAMPRSTPKKIKAMLQGRGVPPVVQRQIITQYFGKKGWDLAVGRSTTAATANDPTRTGGTYMPGGTSGNVSLWADKQVAALKGKTIKPKAAPLYTFKLSRFSNGNWKFVNQRSGTSFSVPARAGELAVSALNRAIARGASAGM